MIQTVNINTELNSPKICNISGTISHGVTYSETYGRNE